MALLRAHHCRLLETATLTRLSSRFSWRCWWFRSASTAIPPRGAQLVVRPGRCPSKEPRPLEVNRDCPLPHLPVRSGKIGLSCSLRHHDSVPTEIHDGVPTVSRDPIGHFIREEVPRLLGVLPKDLPLKQLTISIANHTLPTDLDDDIDSAICSRCPPCSPGRSQLRRRHHLGAARANGLATTSSLVSVFGTAQTRTGEAPRAPPRRAAGVAVDGVIAVHSE